MYLKVSSYAFLEGGDAASPTRLLLEGGLKQTETQMQSQSDTHQIVLASIACFVID